MLLLNQCCYPCYGSPPTGDLKVCLFGCASVALNGRTVTVKQSGATIATGTTSSGCVTFTGLDVGTYDIETDAPTHYDAATTTATVSAGTLTTKNITLTPSSGYSCNCDPCYPGNCSGSAPYVIPPAYPSTITGNDGFDTFTMSKVGGSLLWEAIVTRTATQGYDDPYPFASGCVLPGLTSSLSVPVRWSVYCLGNQWYAQAACWDGKITDPLALGCSGANTCIQAGATVPGTYYPSAAQLTACAPSLGWTLVGFPHGSFATFTPGTGPLNGSATVPFEFFVGGTTRVMPYQVYGASCAFSWTA